MERLVKEYVDYLCSDFPASSKFWELEKQKNSGSMEDFEEFSDDTKEAVGLI